MNKTDNKYFNDGFYKILNVHEGTLAVWAEGGRQGGKERRGRASITGRHMTEGEGN